MTESGLSGVEWIAVDWGTTNLRAWAMRGDRALAAVSAPSGMAALTPDQFEPALLAAVGPWLNDGRAIPVIACGMVGARQGWTEVPYRTVPCPPLDLDGFRRIDTADSRIAVTILHGLSQTAPADVMRGEETQVAGLAEIAPAFDGFACLPGTHTKWARLRGGLVEGFTTFMTGELFALAARQSVLRHSIEDGPTDEASFDEAVAAIAEEPASLAARLFSIRARHLLENASYATARGRLSGSLIGLEVAAMRERWAGSEVLLVGEGALRDLYARAIALLGGRTRVVAAEACTLAGLHRAWRLIAAEKVG